MFWLGIKRKKELVKSNFGRNYGWYIELEGKIRGELIDYQFEDMFWDSYKLIPIDHESEAVVCDINLWIECKFKFRNKHYPQYAENAFIGGQETVTGLGRVSMRGLYLSNL